MLPAAELLLSRIVTGADAGRRHCRQFALFTLGWRDKQGSKSTAYRRHRPMYGNGGVIVHVPHEPTVRGMAARLALYGYWNSCFNN